MSDRVSFDPDAMDDVAGDLRLHAIQLDVTGGDVDAALLRYQVSSSEVVPCWPAHGATIARHADTLRRLGDDVQTLADQARGLDGRGLDLQQVAERVGTWAGGIVTANSAYGAVSDLARRAVHALRFGAAHGRRWLLRHRWGPRPMPDIAKVRARTPGGHALPRGGPGGARELQKQQYRENQQVRREQARRARAARDGMRTGGPVTRAGESIRRFMTETRTGRALERGGRGLGWLGVGSSALGVKDGIADRDAEAVAVNGLAVAGGAAMLLGGPVTVGVGAAVTAGVLVYENRDTISAWGSKAAGAVADTGRKVAASGREVVDGARKLFDSIF